jgi:hypothetical protein
MLCDLDICRTTSDPKPSNVLYCNNNNTNNTNNTSNDDSNIIIRYTVNGQDFERIWQRYPKRIGKQTAQAWFRRTVRTKVDLDLINKALDNYLASREVSRGYIQQGRRWFKEWKDWAEAGEAAEDHGAGSRELK